MNILYIVPSLRTGGAETVATNYCIQLKNKGHKVLIAVAKKTGNTPNLQRIKENSIPIFYLTDNGKMGNVPGLRTLLNILRIVRIIKKEDIQIAHFHVIPFIYIYITGLLCPKVHLFYTIHSELRHDLHGTSLFLAKKMAQRNRIKIITLHKKMHEEAIEVLGGNNIDCVPNGITLAAFSGLENKRSLRRKNGIPDDAYVVGHVGSFFAVKNHKFIIEVFSKILETRPNSLLLLVGSGAKECEKEIADLIDSKNIKNATVILQNRSDIPELLSLMDVFFFPSLYEGFPLVLLEAQAAGLHCVISDRINNEVIASKLVKTLSLEDRIDKWVNSLLFTSDTDFGESIITQYDISRSTDRLIGIYQGVNE